jgi:hypothetical protein
MSRRLHIALAVCCVMPGRSIGAERALSSPNCRNAA